MPFTFTLDALTVSLKDNVRISDVKFNVKFCSTGPMVSLIYSAALSAFTVVIATAPSPTISLMVVESIVMYVLFCAVANSVISLIAFISAVEI